MASGNFLWICVKCLETLEQHTLFVSYRNTSEKISISQFHINQNWFRPQTGDTELRTHYINWIIGIYFVEITMVTRSSHLHYENSYNDTSSLLNQAPAVILKLIFMTYGWDIPSEIALTCMSLDLTEDKSTLVQVMAWCHQVTSIIQANGDRNVCCHMASLGHNELIEYFIYIIIVPQSQWQSRGFYELDQCQQ